MDGMPLCQPWESSRSILSPAVELEVARGCQGAMHDWRLLGGADAPALSTVCPALVATTWCEELPLQLGLKVSPLAFPMLLVTPKCAGADC